MTCQKTVIAQALVILLLSVFVNAFAVVEKHGCCQFTVKDDKAKNSGGVIDPAARAKDTDSSSSNDNSGNGVSTHHKVKEINRLFRSSNDNSGSSSIDSIPVIPKMNFAQTNETNATITIPVYNGVVGGPCLDPNMHTIIP